MPPLVVGKPNLLDPDGFMKDVKDILATRHFTNVGPYALELERMAADYLQVKHVISVSNATAGLELALRAADFAPGSEVIVPSYTFVATAHAVATVGLTPVFCDANATSHLIDLASAEECVSDRTVAIIGVHLWGLACDADALDTFAERHGLRVMFDAAHAFGTDYTDGKKVGTRGSAEVFSMHATKLFNSFEGGLITTNDDELAHKCRIMRNFGISGQDVVSIVGTNAKMSEIHCALGIRHLAVIEKTKAHYRRLAQKYQECMAAEGLSAPAAILWNEPYLKVPGCTHSYVLVQLGDEFGHTRDEVMALLRDEQIFAKRYFYPGLHKLTPYAGSCGKRILPATDLLNERCLTLPTGTTVEEDDVARIVAALAKLSRDKTSSPTRTIGPGDHDTSALNARLQDIQLQKKKLLEEVAKLDHLQETISLTFATAPSKKWPIEDAATQSPSASKID